MNKERFVSALRSPPGFTSRRREAVTMSFLFGTIGDRLGVPMETMTRSQILARNGGSEVTTYLDPHPWRAAIPEWGTFTRIGQSSDDTALMLSSMRAIKRGNGQYHVMHAAMELVNTVLHNDVQGWGGTVRGRAEEIKRYFTSFGAQGASPHDPPPRPDPGLGRGNGAILRTMPIIWADRLQRRSTPPTAHSFFLHRASPDEAFDVLMRDSLSHPNGANQQLARNVLVEQLLDDAVMTHSPSVAGVLTVHHVLYIFERLLPLSLFTRATKSYPLYCKLSSVTDRGDRVHERLPEVCVTPMKRHEKERYAEYHEHVRKVRFLRTCSIEELVEAMGNDGDAAESVPLALWIAIRHADDPRAALIEAVNAGGDTDSIAFLVGQLVGYYSTLDQLPAEWVEGEVGEELLAQVQEEVYPFLHVCDPWRGDIA